MSQKERDSSPAALQKIQTIQIQTIQTQTIQIQIIQIQIRVLILEILPLKEVIYILVLDLAKL